jgi:hypothetical protein
LLSEQFNPSETCSSNSYSCDIEGLDVEGRVDSKIRVRVKRVFNRKENEDGDEREDEGEILI